MTFPLAMSRWVQSSVFSRLPAALLVIQCWSLPFWDSFSFLNKSIKYAFSRCWNQGHFRFWKVEKTSFLEVYVWDKLRLVQTEQNLNQTSMICSDLDCTKKRHQLRSVRNSYKRPFTRSQKPRDWVSLMYQARYGALPMSPCLILKVVFCAYNSVQRFRC